GGFAPAVAPDGTVIVGSGSAPIRRILADGRFEDVTQLDKEQGETAHESPVFLSDGKRFLFVAVSWDATHGTIRRVLCAATLGASGRITTINLGLPSLPRTDRVIVPARDNRSGNTSLWIQDLTRDTATRVTFSAADEIRPVITPDGTHVFFASDFESFALHI